MELKRMPGDDSIHWIVEGNMDEDSVLRLESIITNSHDRGADITLDLSGLEFLPEIGARSMSIMARKLRDRGSSFRIVGARGHVKERLKVSGVLEDQ
ncbi:MAG: anti-sigma factor antagonist [Candidatus Thermoplasmatota archaeon]|nr:anti-sigma factor antagonist [Candidatus Thermoplasmatota archaeon]